MAAAQAASSAASALAAARAMKRRRDSIGLDGSRDTPGSHAR
jgi:hypothetical protein